jgi:hypothetical protein
VFVLSGNPDWFWYDVWTALRTSCEWTTIILNLLAAPPEQDLTNITLLGVHVEVGSTTTETIQIAVDSVTRR